jgi:hypothetical protein
MSMLSTQKNMKKYYPECPRCYKTEETISHLMECEDSKNRSSEFYNMFIFNIRHRHPNLPLLEYSKLLPVLTFLNLDDLNDLLFSNPISRGLIPKELYTEFHNYIIETKFNIKPFKRSTKQLFIHIIDCWYNTIYELAWKPRLSIFKNNQPPPIARPKLKIKIKIPTNKRRAVNNPKLPATKRTRTSSPQTEIRNVLKRTSDDITTFNIKRIKLTLKPKQHIESTNKLKRIHEPNEYHQIKRIRLILKPPPLKIKMKNPDDVTIINDG